MQKPPKKRWLDVLVILASVAVTSTLAFWNTFAKGSHTAVSPAGSKPKDTQLVITETPTPTIDPYAPVQLPKVHLLLGGSMPVARVVIVNSSPAGTTGTSGRGNGGDSPVGTFPTLAPPLLRPRLPAQDPPHHDPG